MIIEESTIHHVSVGHEDREFIRFASNAWMEWMGESLESVFDSEDLEAEFQARGRR